MNSFCLNTTEPTDISPFKTKQAELVEAQLSASTMFINKGLNKLEIARYDS